MATANVQVLCKNSNGIWGWRNENSLKGYTKLTKNTSGQVVSEAPISLDLSYTGEPKPITLLPGKYKIECWGASGGWGTGRVATNTYGKGGYTSGVISLIDETVLWIYIGRKGSDFDQSDFTEASFNGGGFYTAAFNNGHSGGGGGGATDVRLVGGNWDDVTSLRSRIMVAGGGGGAQSICGGPNSPAGHGGGLSGGTSLNQSGTMYNDSSAYGGTQTAGGSGLQHNGWWVRNGSFGKGANSETCGAGGGGGYYGGGAAYTAGGAGGSSFISGHPGCNAINASGAHTNQSTHYSGYVFRDTVMTQGVKDGDGAIKITLVEPYIFGTYLIRENGRIGWREFKSNFDINFDVSDIGSSIPVNLKAGRYKVELWGAAGEGASPTANVGSRRGKGGYTSGELSITSDMTLYVFIGGSGGIQSTSGDQLLLIGGFNGGGETHSSNNGAIGGPGGGATDIRIINGNWDDTASLRSRIMVAGGGGGTDDYDGMGINRVGTGAGGSKGGANDGSGGDGGGLSGVAGTVDGVLVPDRIPPGTQTTGFAFGKGGPGRTADNDAGGGGGGYYGGWGSDHNNGGGAGGSSFISGHPGCNAIDINGNHTNQPNHYSGLIFTNTIMTSGANDGNGNAKITLLELY